MFHLRSCTLLSPWAQPWNRCESSKAQHRAAGLGSMTGTAIFWCLAPLCPGCRAAARPDASCSWMPFLYLQKSSVSPPLSCSCWSFKRSVSLQEVPIQLFQFLGAFQVSSTANLPPFSPEQVTKGWGDQSCLSLLQSCWRKKSHQRDWLGSLLLLTMSPAESQGLDKDWACLSFPGHFVTCPGFETV